MAGSSALCLCNISNSAQQVFIKCLLFSQHGVHVIKEVSEVRQVFYLQGAYKSGHATHSSSETLLGFLLP